MVFGSTQTIEVTKQNDFNWDTDVFYIGKFDWRTCHSWYLMPEIVNNRYNCELTETDPISLSLTVVFIKQSNKTSKNESLTLFTLRYDRRVDITIEPLIFSRKLFYCFSMELKLDDDFSYFLLSFFYDLYE